MKDLAVSQRDERADLQVIIGGFDNHALYFSARADEESKCAARMDELCAQVQACNLAVEARQELTTLIRELADTARRHGDLSARIAKHQFSEAALGRKTLADMEGSPRAH